MLISCPECERQVSDRAAACPACGFPIAEHVAAEAAGAARDEERSSRVHVGEVDCAICEARGFRMVDPEGSGNQVFRWCATCEHSGRVPLCQSSGGYFAVAYARLEEYLAGAIGEGGDDVRALGPERPQGHRYPEPGPRKSPGIPAVQAIRGDTDPEEPRTNSPATTSTSPLSAKTERGPG
jgi:hypothetical protein